MEFRRDQGAPADGSPDRLDEKRKKTEDDPNRTHGRNQFCDLLPLFSGDPVDQETGNQKFCKSLEYSQEFLIHFSFVFRNTGSAAAEESSDRRG